MRGYLLAGVLLSVATATRPARAQQDPVMQAGSTDDSARVLRDARRAQERFERVHRTNLPQDPPGSGGSCDMHVGRFCYSYDEVPLPPGAREPRAITGARSRLLGELASAAARIPADRWVLGQRVRYLLDAGDTTAALSVARACTAEAWRCAALGGLALHVAQRYAEADSAFRVALAHMSRDQRCAWTDISMLLDGRARRRYEHATCEQRAALEDRFWWLARPLLSSASNDIRTEWLARRTLATIEQDARSTYELAWGKDDEELLLRFGRMTWWTREPLTSATGGSGWATIGHSRTPAFQFVPDDRLLEQDDAIARPVDWMLAPRFSAFRYAPEYATAFVIPEHQVAVFRRGDSARVAVAYDVSRDSVLGDAPIRAAVVLQPSPADSPVVVRNDDAKPRGVLVASTRWSPTMLALEARTPAGGHVARLRTSLVLPPRNRRVELSDLLLYDPAAEVDARLDVVAPHAIPSTTIAGGRVGVFWETYGLSPAGEAVAVTLTMTPAATPWLRRAAQAAGLVNRPTPLDVRWQEAPDTRTGIASRALVVDIASFPAGVYRMQLTMATAGGDRATAERVIAIRH